MRPASEPSGHFYSEIQGLRALATMAVIACHQTWTPFGWIGVWVFFPISGFVITLSLLSNPLRGSAGLVDFYRRRIARLAPLYVVVVAFGMIASLAGLWVGGRPPRELAHVPFLIAPVYNFYRIWPGYETTTLFGHLWSLAVEEQFYLVFPLAFFFLKPRTTRGLLLACLLASPLIRFACWWVLSGQGWSGEAVANAAYQFSPGHFDAFAIGCLLALEVTETTSAGLPASALKGVWPRMILAVCLLGAIATYATTTHVDEPGRAISQAFASPQGVVNEVAVYGLITALAGSVIAAIAAGRFWVRWLRWPPLTHIGGLSYGLYMIHFPLRVVQEHLPGPEWMKSILYLALVYGLALASKRLLEDPAGRWIRGLGFTGWTQPGVMADISRPKSDSPAR